MKGTVFRMILTLLLVSVLTLTTVFLAEFSVPVNANPIPIPTLIMPVEYINATISSVGGNLIAKVDGAYPFRNAFYNAVRMDYPLPPGATNIYVKMNETLLGWTYNNKTYPTVIGNWPMINWTISNLSNFAYFTIKAHYEHTIPVVGGNQTFLYAMGTGRFLQTYAKNTTAYVRVRMETGYGDLHVYTIGNVSGAWTWHPAFHGIIHQYPVDTITLNVTSLMWQPLKEDFMMTFSRGQHPGGYSIPVETWTTPNLLALYIALAAILAGVFTSIKRKTHRRTTF